MLPSRFAPNIYREEVSQLARIDTIMIWSSLMGGARRQLTIRHSLESPVLVMRALLWQTLGTMNRCTHLAQQITKPIRSEEKSIFSALDLNAAIGVLCLASVLVSTINNGVIRAVAVPVTTLSENPGGQPLHLWQHHHAKSFEIRLEDPAESV